MNAKEEITERWNRVESEVKHAGRNVWLAGLGAVSTVDERSRDMFAELVERGQKVDAGEEQVLAPWRQTRERVKTVGRRLERDVEEGMTTVLHRLGIPARDDLRQLSDRVEKLTRQVEVLAKG